MDIDGFIHQLASAETAPDAFNQYAYGSPYNDLRRANFRRYLLTLAERQPSVMLVMEAPGYRGSRLTGIPVTSRRILLEGLPALDLFGVHNGYQDVTEPGFERIQGEQSATILWGVMAETRTVPLIWNSFPFHPHRLGEALTNRRPRQPEVRQGAVFLQQIMALFQPGQIIAVGNVADEALRKLDISAAKVRHPAQGGKNDFVAGMQKLLG